MIRGFAFGLLLLTGLSCCSPCLAEIIPPGVYRGTYHIDRWGQHRFGYLFVSPKLERKLKPYAGVPLSLHAIKVDQPESPGGAMITAIGDATRLPVPVGLKIEWKEGSEAASRRDHPPHQRREVDRAASGLDQQIRSTSRSE